MAESSSHRDLLGSIQMFADLSPEELDALQARAVFRRCADGEILFLEGEPCRGMYLLAAGTLRIFKSSGGGREIVLAFEKAPAAIAETPVFDGGPYPASCQALGEVSVYLVSKQAFHELCLQHPEVALKILASAGSRLRNLVGLVHQLTFGGVRQRLAALLLDLETQHGGSPFPLEQTHQDLALSLGSVREVISRNLGRFQAHGLIRIENREVSIIDRQGLQNEADTEMR